MKIKVADTVAKFFALCGLIGCCVWLAGCQMTSVPQGEWVQVTRVASGQTIEVLDPSGRNPLATQVRLLGIEAPHWSKQQPWSLAAKQQLEALIEPDKTVLLEFDIESDRVTKDGKSLRLAYLWHDNKLLNEVLVEEGFVLANSRSPNIKYEQRLSDAQEKARLLGVGIWNPQNPMRQDPNEVDET